MKATRPDVRFPCLYQAFGSAQEIADVINRSVSYVKTALRKGFTEREWLMLSNYTGREDLKTESEAI